MRSIQDFWQPKRDIANVMTLDNAYNLNPDEALIKPRTGFARQLERDIFEHTPAAISFPCVGRLEVNDRSRRDARIERLRARTGLAGDQAWLIAEALQYGIQALELTPRMVDSVMDKIRAVPLDGRQDKAWRYTTWLVSLACELPQLQAEIDIPAESYEHFVGEFTRRGYQGLTRSLFAIENKEAPADYLDVFGRPVEETETPYVDAHDENGRQAGTEAVRYHPMKPAGSWDWLNNQPPAYRNIIYRVRKAGSARDLDAIRAEVEGSNWESYWQLARMQLGKGLCEILRTHQFSRFRKIRKDVLIDGSMYCPGEGDQITEDAQVLGGWVTITANRDLRTKRVTGPARWLVDMVGPQLAEELAEWYYTNLAPLSHRQTVTFNSLWWGRLNAIRAAQPKPNITGQAATVKARIEAAQSAGRLKFVGSQMIKFQRGELGPCQINKGQWFLLWDFYKARQKELAA